MTIYSGINSLFVRQNKQYTNLDRYFSLSMTNNPTNFNTNYKIYATAPKGTVTNRISFIINDDVNGNGAC